jgi:hypothetical protein
MKVDYFFGINYSVILNRREYSTSERLGDIGMFFYQCKGGPAVCDNFYKSDEPKRISFNGKAENRFTK